MKLMYRLHLSFAILLVCILALAAAVIYPLMMETLIDGQRKEMREQGTQLMQIVQLQPSVALNTPYSTRTPWTETDPVVPKTESAPTKPEPALAESAAQLIPSAIQLDIKTNALLVEPDQKVSFSTLPQDQSLEWANIVKKNMTTGGDVWQGSDDQYIVEKLQVHNTTATATAVSAVPASTLVLTSPLSKIKLMQIALFKRMMILLSAGGLLAYLLSVIITRKLVTPLIMLRNELKKVENRWFSDVRLVESPGEIGDVAKTVFQLAGELDKHQRTQKQFFQNASHELKTPLMSIQGYAEGIRDGIFTGEQADKGLDVIVNECDRLKKIVTEMILLAKLESEDGLFQTAAVPVEELVTETIERMNPLLMQKGLSIQVKNAAPSLQPLFIDADREKLLQALINIVGNAAKYAQDTIRIQITQHHDKGTCLEIADDGEGIPEELLPQLFQRFMKGKNGDTGLGLAISRAIVERCRGQISAYNQKDGGAAFVLHFPASQAVPLH
ncbi:sensor histidine kinase [Paenibacillus sp. NPDC056579]|uniref:sensor histidine kinase n=1 Tax=Paenibacillus sp. NPDC056579 TaxID=3345871 RepID=UPI0036C0C771